MKLRNKEEEGAEVLFNLTPMIDCVFLLNIFFMVSTSFLNLEKEMNLDLPEAASGKAEEVETDEIIINVLEDGRMKVGEQYFDKVALVERLKQAALRNPETPVVIRGDRGTDLQNAVHAMDACGQANLRRISVGLLGDAQRSRGR